MLDWALYTTILKEYFALLFFGTFGLSTLFLIALFLLSYKYKKIIALLSYMGAATIPFWFGIASRYMYDEKICTELMLSANGAHECDHTALAAFFVYFFVNGILALGFWVLRSRQEAAPTS